MDINEMNQLTIETALNAALDSVDDGIQISRIQYENINNDYFAEAKKRLEIFLFRLYECKYLLVDKIKDFDRKRYLLEDSYYQKTWIKLRSRMDLKTGQKAYEKGVTCVREKNYAKAGEFFRIAAMAGDSDGQFNYGVTVSNGEGCEIDELEGAFWYWEAAKHGNSKAMMNLAIAYRNGSGVKADGVQMLWWYACSAGMLDNPVAVYNLGLCLKHEEVLAGKEIIGRRLIDASNAMLDEREKQFVTQIAKQVKEILEEYVYNIE
ncbi:MAG: tetratricopeptide repeat protein [Eubacteriales bacterium]|nr:tetratricopeptide repeat protein [Eubacteriales bacterium]